MPETRVCFGLIGPFDVDSLDVQLSWRITANELRRRRPEITVRSFAPFGSERPLAIAADEPLEPLLPDTEERRTALGAELSAAIVVPGPFAGDDLARCYAGNPQPDPRDVRQAAQLLSELALPVATARLDTALHPAHIARRWWSYAMCEQRRDFLRAMHWWPHHLPALVVQGGRHDVGQIDLLAAELPNSPVVVLEAEPGDEQFSARMLDRLGPRALRLPASRSSLEDRVAAVAGAATVIAAAPAVHALAAAYARPSQSLAERVAGCAAHEAPARATEGDALEIVYDELARLDGGAPRPVTVDDEINALRRALEERGRRMAQERVVLADYVRAVRNVTNDQVQQLEASLQARLSSRVVHRLRGRGRG